MEWPFVPHQRYVRRSEIHGVFGGNQQGGMVPVTEHRVIFLFTGSGGALANYADGFLPDGTFRYTGEGQSGDQQFIRANRALRDHLQLGFDVLLFEKVGTSPSVTFVGQFACLSYDFERQNGRDSLPRQAIVFDLTPIEAAETTTEADALPPATDLETLRRRAYAAAAPAQAKHSAASRSIYHRSKDVKDYVLARAAGSCEACGSPAPFVTNAGTPYLEPHHIDRLSDGGPDSPDRVGAVCPNCHRAIHCGVDGKIINSALRKRVLEREKALP